MSKEVVKSNKMTTVTSSGNISSNNEGVSMYNKFYYTYNFIVRSKKKKKRQGKDVETDDDSSTEDDEEDQMKIISNPRIVPTCEDQKKIIPNEDQKDQIEVNSNDKVITFIERLFFNAWYYFDLVQDTLISNLRIILSIEDQKNLRKAEALKFVWKYLGKEDKLNCTLVCKRFNNFISSMDCFSLYIDTLEFDNRKFPKLTRYYTSLIIHHYKLYFLSPRMLNTLIHLSQSVINFRLECIETNMITLCDILCKLPLLESLDLVWMNLMDSTLSLEDLPAFLHLRKLKINMNHDDKMKGVLAIFRSAPNIESVSFINSKMEVRVVNCFFNRHKNSLRTLRLERFTMIDTMDSKYFNIFDCFLQLRKLYISCDSDLLLKVLKSKCVNWLTDFEIKYRSRERDKINSFLRQYFLSKEINEGQLTKYEAQKYNQPIKINTKFSFSKNIITSFYHFHNCASESLFCYDHNKCQLIPLTKLKSNLMRNRYYNSFLSIQVRDSVKEFKNVKERYLVFDEY